MSRDVTEQVTSSHATDIDKDLDIDKEKDKDILSGKTRRRIFFKKRKRGDPIQTDH